MSIGKFAIECESSVELPTQTIRQIIWPARIFRDRNGLSHEVLDGATDDIRNIRRKLLNCFHGIWIHDIFCYLCLFHRNDIPTTAAFQNPTRVQAQSTPHELRSRSLSKTPPVYTACDQPLPLHATWKASRHPLPHASSRPSRDETLGHPQNLVAETSP